MVRVWDRWQLPVRLRLTVAYATATLAVLAGSGLFVYLRLRADLDDSVNASLRARWEAAADMVAAGQPITTFPLEDPEEAFIQIVGIDGRIIERVGGATGDAVGLDDLDRVSSTGLVAEGGVTGIDGRARVVARAGRNGPAPVIVVGQSLVNRDEALHDLLISFLIGGPVAVALASAAGYSVARAGFAPVDSLRAAAAAISVRGDGARLPVPDTRDEIHRLAVTLNDMIARLEQSWERERRFVSDASHELRTPIAVIKTELEAAAGADADVMSVAESIRAAIDECDGLAQLADDLLTLSRADEAGLQLSCVPLAVRPLLEDVRNRFLDRATRHARQIVIKADPGLDVVADEVRIRQALSNLLDNALRHGAGTIRLGATADQTGIHLEVSDEGPGFSPSLAEQALNRFVRGEKARAARGAGLGLAIVHTIMSAHGGDIVVVAGQPAIVRLNVPPAATDTLLRDTRPGLNTAAASQRPVEPPRGCSS